MIAKAPPDFKITSEAQQATWDNGYRLERGITGAWLRYGSTTAPGDLWLAAVAVEGPWLLALDHPGVIAELADLPAAGIEAPGAAAFRVETQTALYAALNRVYRLAVSLPDAPLVAFDKSTARLPKTTEAERLVVQRVGQNIFRAALLDYWGNRCPLTGVAEPRLLRASHIKPWAECDSDAERLDVHNGLLLAAHLDAAFDAGLISFDDDGAILFSPVFSSADRAALGLRADMMLAGLTAKHRARLAWHRENVLERPEPSGPGGPSRRVKR